MTVSRWALVFVCCIPVAARAQDAVPPALLASCESCHGANGQTVNPQTPRLNGQTREYLVARLKDLRNPSRQSVNAIHAMLGPVRGIREDQIVPIADHFAAQAPNEAGGNGQDQARGALLFAAGDGTRLAGCAGCHGARGEGRGEAARLAGQRGPYLQNQLEALQLTARIQPVMNGHAAALTPDDIQALVAFLAGD